MTRAWRWLWLLAPAAVAIVGCPALLGPRAADNSRCYVCHMNYEEEELAVTHARNGVGCERCHGPSDAHCGDENNATPPDIMYPRDAINAACLKCHPSLPRTADHKPILANPAKSEKVCTDCHGEHRLGYRTRHWDKRTGKLIEQK